MKKIKLDYRAFFFDASEERKKFVGKEAVFHPTTDKEVMKFKMQKAQIHSRLARMSLRHQTWALIALALIYLETWRKFTACCPTRAKIQRKGKNQFGFAIISTGKRLPLAEVVHSPFY